MNNEFLTLANKLINTHSLSVEEYKKLILLQTEENSDYLAQKADAARKEIYGNKVFIRGLIEISNICKNDCLYCGIRRSNKNCERYRLSQEEILECCKEGYSLGFRTFVLQGGEDGHFSDSVICELVSEIKKLYPDCAITLSLGERSRESYQKLYNAGADRYLLRHETASKEHYEKLHPSDMKFENRMECLRNLKEIGFQTGCGFMVGSPYQTVSDIAKDLKFIEEFSPEMCGIGPFIPHKDTQFKDFEAGSVDLTCYLLSIIRLIKPNILLPATTALGSLDPLGREKGIKAGANVIMPNLSPASARNKYQIYNNKLSDGTESAQNKANIDKRMLDIGYRTVTERGDIERMI